MFDALEKLEDLLQGTLLMVLLVFLLGAAIMHSHYTDDVRRFDAYIQGQSRIFAEQVTGSGMIDKDTYEHYVRQIRAYDPTASVDINIRKYKDGDLIADIYDIERCIDDTGEYRLQPEDVFHMSVFCGRHRHPVYTAEEPSAAKEAIKTYLRKLKEKNEENT